MENYLSYTIFLCKDKASVNTIASHCVSVNRLSGLSPFAGDTDEQTLRNVGSCDWEFDSETFSSVSDHAKDFIRRLLIRSGA